ncbi:hypothetical protein ACFRAU_14445 [Arthrobacter sp. NPDC056691]|uniref:hypothetical protein n=1 Tax=Arthrobacter sp. NPDC056691 TaxID=3345913 RepID=UPI00366C5BCB
MPAKIPSGTDYPADRKQPHRPRPSCTACGTDEHLLAESITVLDQRGGSVAVTFSCSACRGPSVLATTAEFLAPVLARYLGPDDDVVHVGAAYIHCGEPMTPSDVARRQLERPVHTQPGPADFLDAYLQTRVLHCRCGFQMEPPRHRPGASAEAAEN